MTKFNVGDKVVPISKTVDWNTLNRTTNHLDKSSAWNKALENEQKYLYVNIIDEIRNLYTCSNEPYGGGDYFHESDLTPYKTKPTKKQRITALENEVAELRPLKQEVAELKLIVHELRDGPKTMRDVMNEVLSEPSTTTVEDIIEFEGQQYRKVDRVACEGDVVVFNSKIYPHNAEPNKPYIVNRETSFGVGHHDGETICDAKFAIYDHGRTPENVDVYELIEGGLNPHIPIVDETIEPLTPNQQRAAIIEKARQFVDATASDDTHFEIQDNQVLAWRIIRKGTGYDALTGVAVCSPNDVFNKDIGRAIAVGRMEGLDVSEFEQAVQPNDFVSGQIIKADHLEHLGEHQLTKVENHRAYFDHNGEKEFHWADRINEGDFHIINDTNAIYEEGQ